MSNEQRHPNQQAQSRIPEFATREEETEFWDTHDFTDFLDELRPVQVRVAKNLSQGLNVRLDQSDREELNRRAEEQGIGPSTLIRMWVRERLRQGTTPASHS